MVVQLLIAYIVDMQPFLTWLETRTESRPTSSDKFIFSRYEDPMSPGELTEALKAMTGKYLGVQLGV